jgi:type II secretory pathway pseudopilin PulG
VSDVQAKRRRYRFSLRTLFIGILAVALVCGWFAAKLQIARRQQQAVATIRATGAEVGYDYNQNRPPQWLTDLQGVDFFCPVITVHVYPNTNITDADLALLKTFPNLQCLYINRSSITDAGLKNLSALTRLQFLYLDRPCISDEGLRSLQNLAQLRELDLSKTQITDGSLKQLRELKSLQMLNLRDTNVTTHGVQELKQALPGVNVVR